MNEVAGNGTGALPEAGSVRQRRPPRAGGDIAAAGATAPLATAVAATSDEHVLASDTVRQGLRHVMALHLRRLRQCDPGTRAGDDLEALHDMRVATRRLRAALRIFAAGIPTGLHRTLSRKLQWLGRLLGQVRDLDVQLARLDGFTTAAPAGFRPALGCLREYMEKKRERCRAEMLAGLDSPRYVRLLLQLETFAHAPAGGRPRAAAAREPIATAGRRAIKKAFRRLRQRGKGIKAMPRPEDLHALRMRAKRLRYLLEFLTELSGKPGRRLVRRLTALQNLLGSYHDAVVAADIARVYVETLGRQLAPSQIVALGALVSSELRVAEQKRADFESTWRRFARRRTAADCRAVVRRLRNLQPPAPETGVGARPIEVHEPPTIDDHEGGAP